MAMNISLARGRGWRVPIVAVLIAVSIGIRIALYPAVTSDYTFFLSQWYDFIAGHGGFAAFKYPFSNYNPPYLYLIAVSTYLPIARIVAIKTISVLFDGVLSLCTYLLLRRLVGARLVPVIGALLILFAPTIILNSAAWGQSDGIYTAFCLGSLYFLMCDRPAWACVLYGVAISFKLQAIFFLPVLMLPFLRRTFPLRTLILVPAVFLLMLTPALLAGRDIGSLVNVYVNQAQTGGMGPGGGGFGSGPQQPAGHGGQAAPGRPGGGAGGFKPGGGAPQGRPLSRGNGSTAQSPGSQPGGPRFGSEPGGGASASLVYGAPTFYQWLPAGASSMWKWIGMLLAGLAVLALAALAVLRRERLTPDVLLRFALLTALVIPFLLPEMHERYFYLADVLSISFACRLPRLFFVAIAVQGASLLCYLPYLLNIQVTYVPFVSGIELATILVVSSNLLLTLYPALPVPPPLRSLRTAA